MSIQPALHRRCRHVLTSQSSLLDVLLLDADRLEADFSADAPSLGEHALSAPPLAGHLKFPPQEGEDAQHRSNEHHWSGLARDR
eukprot:2915347-Pyramimonas_sp.AAC.1